MRSDNPLGWPIENTNNKQMWLICGSDIILWVRDANTDTELYSFSLVNIQGADFTSHENSAKQSLNNLFEILQSSELDKILRYLKQ